MVEFIVICGMGMWFLGGIIDVVGFWDMFYNGCSGWCEVLEDWYNVEGWYGLGKIGYIVSKFGYFFDNVNLVNMDFLFWFMIKKEIEVMDL